MTFFSHWIILEPKLKPVSLSQRGLDMFNSKSLVLWAALALFVVSPLFAQTEGGPTELLVNGGFEAADLSDWNGAGAGGAGSATIGAPGIGAQSGSNAVKLELFPGVAEVRQIMPCAPGDVINMQGYMMSEVALPPAFETFGLLKVVFRDAMGADILVDTINIGGQNPSFPGVESAPFLNETNTPGAWVFTEAEGVAPAGAVEVLLLALNVDFGAAVEPIWFDNISVTKNGGSILLNGDFESGLDDWIDIHAGGSPFTLGSPPFGVTEGSQAVEFAAGTTTLALDQSFPANPGDEYAMSVDMLTVFGLPAGDSFGLCKIVFRDAMGADLQVPVENVIAGQAADDDGDPMTPAPFPGIESPFLDDSSTIAAWQTGNLAQGIAPAGTVEVLFLVLNVDFAGGTNPIWFDNTSAQLISEGKGCLIGDLNGDGMVNLLDVQGFVDAITSGTFSCEADIDENGVVNLLDVEPFVALLGG